MDKMKMLSKLLERRIELTSPMMPVFAIVVCPKVV